MPVTIHGEFGGGIYNYFNFKESQAFVGIMAYDVFA